MSVNNKGQPQEEGGTKISEESTSKQASHKAAERMVR